MGMVNWSVGRKLAPLNTNWAKVSIGDIFNSSEKLMNYRIGSELPANLSKKSKMKSAILGLLNTNFPDDRKYFTIKFFR